VNWPPVFSEEGAVLACRLTSRRTGRDCIAVDGRRGEEFDRVGAPSLSRDGRHVAYRAHLGDRCFAVTDGKRGPEAEFMTDPAISEDGRVTAYAARRDGRWVLVAGARETALDVQPAAVFLSRDGRAVGYWYLHESRARVVVVDRGPGESFSVVGPPAFSPDGATVAYLAQDGDREFIVVGSAKVPVSGRAGDPVFSPDGSRVGYGVRVDREVWWKVVDVR
jgi:hypothetical protein